VILTHRNKKNNPWPCQRFFKAEEPALFEAAMHIRTVVFVEEQGVPVEAEQDDLDEVAYHYLLSAQELTGQDEPHGFLATGRLVILQDEITQHESKTIGKIGRVAVLRSQRGKGLGKVIMQAMMADGPQLGVTHFALHAQSHALGFYEQLGFEAVGEPFLEEGILHRKMLYRLL
jgi:predicted GNAT family N-acyltransferase